MLTRQEKIKVVERMQEHIEHNLAERISMADLAHVSQARGEVQGRSEGRGL